MKYLIENQTTGYANDRVTFSAEFVIQDDTGVELWRKGFNVSENLSTPDWYARIKSKSLVICQDIKDTYVSKMTKVLTDSGQADEAGVITDISDSITGGII